MITPSPPPSLNGLTAAEAAQRLTTEGYNELSQTRKRSLISILINVVKEPMFALLLAASSLYLLLGDLTEALILTAFASLSLMITVVQEARSEKVLEALRDMTSPRALVVRNGQRQRIQGRDVVRGDILIIKEGDRVAADALLLSAQDIAADESLLTGESVPVHKRVGVIGSEETARAGGDNQPFIYAGTMIVRGQGIAQVTATGKRSEIGKIGQSLDTIDVEPPRLRAQTRKLVRFYATLGLAMSLAAILLYGTMRGDWQSLCCCRSWWVQPSSRTAARSRGGPDTWRSARSCSRRPW
jgi:Ca2+-transporting ATPase